MLKLSEAKLRRIEQAKSWTREQMINFLGSYGVKGVSKNKKSELLKLVIVTIECS